MGALLTNKEEKEVYSAYGMTVYCVENENIWLKNHDSVYTAIRIERNGENIVDIDLDINYIGKRNFEKSIDNFLWWIKEDKPDKGYTESAVYAWLTECNNFLNHRIESRKKYGNRSIYSPM